MANKWNVDRIMRFILFAGFMTLLILLLNYLSSALAPFGVAFIVAYILNPIVDFLTRKMKYRILAVLTVLFSALGFLTLALWLFIPRITKEVQMLGTLLVKLFHDAEWSQKVMQIIPKDIWEFVQTLISWDKIAGAMQTMDFWNAVQTVASKLISGSLGVLSGTFMVFTWISGITLILIYLIFIMLDMPRLKKGFFQLVPLKFQANMHEFAEKMNGFMGNYFRSQTIVASIVGILFAAAFSFIGFPMGIMFGLFIGALNMVPYLQMASIPVALLLGIVYALHTGMPFWQVALIITGIYVVIQLLQDLILVPNIVGKSMNLPPVGILLSLSIWGKLLGFLGLVVAIPFTCLCLVYIDKFSKKSEDLILNSDNPEIQKE